MERWTMRVWIDEGCIACRACEYECPDVFQVIGATSTIRGAARPDGLQDENRGRCELDAEVVARSGERIANAAAGCPVEVIRIEADVPCTAAHGAGAGA